MRSAIYVESDPYSAAVLLARVEGGHLAPGPVVCGRLEQLAESGVQPEPGSIDIVTAGFPCQPASVAGVKKGRSDERWIWPSIAQLLADTRPRAVFLENVPGLLTADRGWALHSVVRDLAALGFVGRYDLVRASDVGAPHRRERWFCRATRHDDVGTERVPDPDRRSLRNLAERGEGRARPTESRDAEPRDVGEEVADRVGYGLQGKQPSGAAERSALGGSRDVVGDSDGGRPEGRRVEERPRVEGASGGEPVGHGIDRGFGWPPGPQDREGWERWLARGGPAPAVSGRLDPSFVEALMGFPIGWTDLGHGDRARRERLRGLGNAVVPDQAAFAWNNLQGEER